MCLTCDLGLNLTLHLQRVNKDAAVADEAGAGDASVRLAEPLFIEILPETHRGTEEKDISASSTGSLQTLEERSAHCTRWPLEGSLRLNMTKPTIQRSVAIFPVAGLSLLTEDMSH